MRAAAIFAVSLFGSACGSLGDRQEPGENLGMFHVVATMTESTCGVGALGAPSVWEFDVKLVRDGSALYWLNGAEYIPGRFASDGATFSFSTSTDIKLSDSNPERAGCVITRIDAAFGLLVEGAEATAEETAVQSTFTGTLTYGYIAGVEDDCSDMIGVPGGFSALPCEIEYALTANVPELDE